MLYYFSVLSICIFHSSDGIDECRGDISVAVAVVAVTGLVKIDTYDAFRVAFVLREGVIPCCL